MQYLGGKKRLSKALTAIMQVHRAPQQRFVDAFCGSLPITAAMGGERIANDACLPLINMYKAWTLGWRPTPCDEQRYKNLKDFQDPWNPMVAFAGFGLSFGGKWYGGYARNSKGPGYYFGTAVRSLEKILSKCDGVEFTSKDFSELPVKAGDMVYCDPPYRDVTSYGYFKKFEHEKFEAWVRKCADIGADVWVSEYNGFGKLEKMFEAPVSKGQLATGKHTEKLFRWIR